MAHCGGGQEAAGKTKQVQSLLTLESGRYFILDNSCAHNAILTAILDC